MDLAMVREVKRLSNGDAQQGDWREGDAWLAGGTWLFSEPQLHLRRLIDLQDLGWPALTITDAGLEIAATCKIVALVHFAAPHDWLAAHLFRECANCFLMSFKIWNTATIGGNLCMSLPAGAMISLTAGLESVCTIWPKEGGERKVSVVDFIHGPQQNELKPGDLLRSITLPTSALRKRAAFRQVSLTHIGRSTMLLIATRCPDTDEFLLTVTASTSRPVPVRFASMPSANDLQGALRAAIPDGMYFADVHGTPEYRKQMTLRFAEELRAEFLTRGHP